jgi:hypothetical protein
MPTDAYTKLLLTVITACLVLLVVQGFRAPEDATPAAERFRVIPVPMGRVMLRVDTETGMTWQTPLPGAVEWRLVDEGHGAAPAPRQAGSPELFGADQRLPAPPATGEDKSAP